jgi:hypothetical protein
MEKPKVEWLSNCCSAHIENIYGDEGTAWAKCSQCKEPCTPVKEKNMPTNNQEKWSERFDKEFPYAWIEFKDDGTHIEKMRLVKSFILQEIRQAKIEGLERAVTIWDGADDLDFYPLIVREINQLKQNDDTTKTLS